MSVYRNVRPFVRNLKPETCSQFVLTLAPPNVFGCFGLGSRVVQVAMGYAHSCVIVKVDGDDALAVRGREAVAALPLYSPDEPDPATGVAAEEAASSGGGQSGPTGKRKVSKGTKGGKKKKSKTSKR